MEKTERELIENNISKLKSDFKEILELYDNLLQINKEFIETSEFLKQKYNYFINLDKDNIEKMEKSSSDTSFVLGLDTFHFQKKMIDLEISNISQVIALMNNQIYCNYYKLYKNIFKEMKSFIIENGSSEKDQNIYPKYNSLYPFIKYDINIIKHVHDKIISIIDDIYKKIIYKEELIQQYYELSKSGISIRNIINTIKFDKNIFIEKMILYIDYMNCYHITQKNSLLKIKKNMENLKEQFLNEIIIHENKDVEDIIPALTGSINDNSDSIINTCMRYFTPSGMIFRENSIETCDDDKTIVDDMDIVDNTDTVEKL